MRTEVINRSVGDFTKTKALIQEILQRTKGAGLYRFAASTASRFALEICRIAEDRDTQCHELHSLIRRKRGAFLAGVAAALVWEVIAHERYFQ